jgi:glycerol-3-phosphate O-acyltransferase
MIQSFFFTWAKIALKIRSWVDRALDGTHDHYSWFLPEKIGRISDFFLTLFYSGIKLKQSQIEVLNDIPEDAIIVYVNKFKSRFEFLFYYLRYQKENLPFPQTGLEYSVWIWQPVIRTLRIFFSHLDYLLVHKKFPDPYAGGYFRRELIAGRGVFLSLVEKKGFYRRFVKKQADPVEHLIEVQKTMARPIYLVPQLMFFGRNPQRSATRLKDLILGPETNPGVVRKLMTLFSHPERIFVEVSQPVNLKQFIHSNEGQQAEHLALTLRRNLLLQINRHRQSIIGPTLKSRQEIKESILTNERLKEFMEQYAENRKLSLYKIRHEADEYIEEIAANYSPAMIRVLEKIVMWLIKIMFDGYTFNEDMLNKIKLMSLKGPLVFIPCHKSHIDYLIMSYLLFNNNMQCPHIAAGKNLSFWPLGPVFRRCGAFFIRRTFSGAVLYSKVFAEYVHKMLEEGFNIEFFIEGTRSRTGKLITPKLGFLSILLNAYKAGACDDLIFVPVYIGYDQVLEENAYLHEIEGAQKKSENLSQLIRARRFLKKRYGKIYIKFDAPFSLNALLTENHHRFAGMTAKEQNLFCRDIGRRVVNSIDQNTVVTAHALVASAILNRSISRFSHESMMSQLKMYINFLSGQNAKLADTLLMDYDRAIEAAVADYEHRKFIERISGDKTALPEDVHYLINESRRPALEYYKNNCIAYFIPAAYTALSVLKNDSFQFSASEIYGNYFFIQELFQKEFLHDINRSSEFLVRKSLKAFIDEAAIVPHPTLPDTYNITSAGLRKLKIFSLFLISYLESYLVAATFFRNTPDLAGTAKDSLKKIQAAGMQMYKNREIERKEALSRVTLGNATDVFMSNGFKNGGKAEKMNFYADEIERCVNYLRAE